MRAGFCLQIMMDPAGGGTDPLYGKICLVRIGRIQKLKIRVCSGKNDLLPPHEFSHPDLEGCRHILALTLKHEAVFGNRRFGKHMEPEVEAVLYRYLLEGHLPLLPHD